MHCTLAAKCVIHTKCKTGRPLSLLQIKKRLSSQVKSEEYWSLPANEMDLFFRKWERIANDLWKFIQFDIFIHIFLFHIKLSWWFYHHVYPSLLGTCLYTSRYIIFARFSLHEYMMILSELRATKKKNISFTENLKKVSIQASYIHL